MRVHASCLAGCGARRAAQADTARDAEQTAKWPAEAEQHRATADLTAAAVEGLTRESEISRDWAATTITRDLGERAHAEAERRGGDWGGIHVQALISRGFLRPYTWTIDFDHHRYLLTKPPHQPK